MINLTGIPHDDGVPDALNKLLEGKLPAIPEGYDSEVLIHEVESIAASIEVVSEAINDLDNLSTSIEEFGISMPTMKVIDPNGELCGHLPFDNYDDLPVKHDKGVNAEIALEGIVETIKKLWDKLVDLITKMHDKFQILIRGLLSIATRMWRGAQRERERVFHGKPLDDDWDLFESELRAAYEKAKAWYDKKQRIKKAYNPEFDKKWKMYMKTERQNEIQRRKDMMNGTIVGCYSGKQINQFVTTVDKYLPDLHRTFDAAENVGSRALDLLKPPTVEEVENLRDLYVSSMLVTTPLGDVFGYEIKKDPATNVPKVFPKATKFNVLSDIRVKDLYKTQKEHEDFIQQSSRLMMVLLELDDKSKESNKTLKRLGDAVKRQRKDHTITDQQARGTNLVFMIVKTVVTNNIAITLAGHKQLSKMIVIINKASEACVTPEYNFDLKLAA